MEASSPLKPDEGTSTALIVLNDSTSSDVVVAASLDGDAIVAQHQNTFRLYRWQTNGTKSLKREDGSQIWRIHYRCSNWNKPDTTNGCKARYSEDFQTKDKRTPISGKKFRPTPHNHPPPSRSSMDSELIDDLGTVHRHKKNAVEKIQAELPKIRNDPNYLRGDTVKQVCMLSEKLIARFGKSGDHFLYHLSIFPEVRIVLAVQKGFELLAQHGQLAVIDASFELTELGFILVTILVLTPGNVLVPVVWFLTDTVSAPNFEWFLRTVQGATGGQWQMAFAYSDFEPSLKVAIQQVFTTNCVIYGDAWHFFHDNHKWVRANGGVEFLDAIDQSLHILWASPSDTEFASSVSAFVNYWATTWHPYYEYFHKQWLTAVAPAEWALFARPPDLPSCDYQLECYENRLLYMGIRMKSPLDVVVQDLIGQWWDYDKIITTPEILAERVKDIEANQHKNHKQPSLHEWIATRPPLPMLSTIPAFSTTTDSGEYGAQAGASMPETGNHHAQVFPITYAPIHAGGQELAPEGDAGKLNISGSGSEQQQVVGEQGVSSSQ